jgi:hypothetical protein
MKDNKGKKIIYIKMMHRKPLLALYTLGNTITTLKGWLNIENLI